MEYEPHSHAYKKDIYARLQYEISEKLKESPQKDEQHLIANLIRHWLDENTELGTRTKKEYIEYNVPKIIKILA
jgi:hypothetical protein